MSISPTSKIPLDATHLREMIDQKVCPQTVGIFGVCENTGSGRGCEVPALCTAAWSKVWGNLKRERYTVRWDSVSDSMLRMCIGLLPIPPQK